MFVQNEHFEERVDEWLTDKPSWRKRIFRAGMALWHNRIPREFRFWGVMHFAAKTMVAAAAPLTAHFLYQAIPLSLALGAAAVIIVLTWLVAFLDRMSQAKKVDDLAPEMELAIRFGEVIEKVESRTTHNGDKDDSIRSALGIIEIIARKETKSAKGEITASLATFNGAHSKGMRLRYRNPGSNRPNNKKFDGTYVLGYHACKAGTDPRVVHDLRHFGSKARLSPTQSIANYRSFFIVPIAREEHGNFTICGFISIDSPKPYAFYGNRANSIIITCGPFIDHIQDLL